VKLRVDGPHSHPPTVSGEAHRKQLLFSAEGWVFLKEFLKEVGLSMGG
jgi:hypothetical protein